MYNVLHIYSDGGSRGNPGRAALGVSITDGKGKEITGFGKTLGIATNNIAEYQAVLAAYDWIVANKKKLTSHIPITFYMDSQLVCMQLLGLYRMKNEGLRTIFSKIKLCEQQLVADTFANITYAHIPREKNKRADYFVNQSLDEERI